MLIRYRFDAEFTDSTSFFSATTFQWGMSSVGLFSLIAGSRTEIGQMDHPAGHLAKGSAGLVGAAGPRFIWRQHALPSIRGPEGRGRQVNQDSRP